MKKVQRTLAALLAGVATLGAAPAQPQPQSAQRPQPTRPNIVIFLVDDMGFSDIGAYGSEIPTPNIDALAAGGLRFTQFYNTARCSPTRASLLTGTYPHQAGMGHLDGVVVPGSLGLHGRLDDRVVTFAQVLKDAGYHTGIAGKWHLGLGKGTTPWNRGFDRSLVSPAGGIYFPNQVQPSAQTLFLDGRKLPAKAPEIGENWYSSDLFVDWGARFAAEAREQNKPFLLYVPFVAAHFPLMAPPEDIAKFKGKYLAGWDALRRERFARQKKLGIVGPEQQLPARLPNTYDWNKLTPEQRDRFDTLMAVYAATIARMDQAVGALVERLRTAGELDNTLILFMADNGGNAEAGPDGRMRGGTPGGPDSTLFNGMNWATLQNTPFQYFKHHTHEGGIASPLIAYWPRGIRPALRGSLVREPGHLIDVMPTLVELSGASYPKQFDGHAILPLPGRSFAPAFRGARLTRGQPIFFEHEGNRAVRGGDWKLVARYGKPWELYNMARDRSETRDLAKTMPERVERMARQWDDWAKASYVDPWQESYNLRPGAMRRNWGGTETPQLPQAMNSSVPD